MCTRLVATCSNKLKNTLSFGRKNLRNEPTAIEIELIICGKNILKIPSLKALTQA
jgi:hypothetical protein